jgi:hypothetical protein
MSDLPVKESSQSHFVVTVALTSSLTGLGFYLFAQTTSGQGSQPGITNNEPSQSPLAKCLPADVKLNDVVEASIVRNANGQHRVTVEQKLNEFKATCNGDNKLIDGSGRQIAFYHLIGCWGNPPADYQELLEKQREEINKLRQQFTVIEMTCNPSGANIQ